MQRRRRERQAKTLPCRPKREGNSQHEEVEAEVQEEDSREGAGIDLPPHGE